MTADPTRRLSSIDVLDEAEHARLDGWGNRAVLTRPAPRGGVDSGVVRRAGGAHPGGGGGDLRGPLDDLPGTRRGREPVGALAGWPRCGPGCSVWRCCWSVRPQAIVAMLAVLKTGAAYLPIDPALPATRGSGSCSPMPRRSPRSPPPAWPTGWTGVTCVVIDVSDTAASAVDGQPSTALPAPAPDDIAYLIYTSGTTGAPKGVADHPPQRDPAVGGVDACRPAGAGRCGRSGIRMPSTSRCGRSSAALLRWRAAGGGARVGGALTGGLPRVAGRRTGQRVDPDPVGGGGCLSPQGLESVALVVGGEACPAEVVDRWAPGRVMINAYGPTETTVYAAMSAPLSGGVGGAADRFAGGGGGVVRAGWVVAAGAGGGGR